MTRYPISPKSDPMGRKRKNFDVMNAGFGPGTFQRIDRLLKKGETRKDYLRKALEQKLQQDEAAAEQSRHQPDSE